MAELMTIQEVADYLRVTKKTIYRLLGHGVKVAETTSQGLELVKQQDFDLVFLDLKMPGMDGAGAFYIWIRFW